MEMLDVGTIRLTKNNLLGGVKSVPRGFAAVEFGTFSVRDKTAFSEDELVVASDKMEAGYLSHFDATKAHFMGRIDDQTYSEITFAETTGTALHMREDYAENETCRALLEFAAPETVDIDLWHLLA